MTTHVAEVKLNEVLGWQEVTRPLPPERAAEFMTLMLADSGVPVAKLHRACAVLVEGAELETPDGRAYRIVRWIPDRPNVL